MTRRERLRLALSVSYVDLPRLQPITLPRTWSPIGIAATIAALVAAAAVLASCAGSAPGAESPPSSPGVRAVSKHFAWCGDSCEGLPNLGTEPRVRR